VFWRQNKATFLDPGQVEIAIVGRKLQFLAALIDRKGATGLERIKQLIAQHSAQPLRIICEMLMSEARKFGAQADDQSVLLVRWR